MLSVMPDMIPCTGMLCFNTHILYKVKASQQELSVRVFPGGYGELVPTQYRGASAQCSGCLIGLL